MSLTAWITLGCAAMVVMALASRSAVDSSAALARALRLPPFLIGFTLVSFGTDLPEIVSSIVACYLGRGDVAVGNSIGSVYTQAALILGLFPIVAGAAQHVNRREVFALGTVTLAALGAGIVLLRDGRFTRADAALLIAIWLLVTVLAARFGVVPLSDGHERAPGSRSTALALRSLGAFVVVGVSAAALVESIAIVSIAVGVPQYVLGFFVAAIGTSLPELVTEVLALRKGEAQLALGNVLGACLMDAAFSVSAGPLLFPVSIDGVLAVRGSMAAAGTILLATLLLGVRGKHDRWSAATLLAAYGVVFLVLAPA